jgi:cytochrome c peroxidase
MKRWFLIIALVGGSLFLSACGGGSSSASITNPPATDQPTTATYPGISEYLSINPAAPLNYTAPVLPAHYDRAVLAGSNDNPANAISDQGATLGRVLFNDVRLSFNNTKSCASCHSQATGFADTAQFSTGFGGASFTTAHAMRLANIRFYQAPANGTATMFWDKRAATLEAQATQPIKDPIEMGFDASHGGFAALITKMQALPYYPELFSLAFGDSTITEVRVQNALAQFQRTMISSGSKWDRAYAVVYAANGNVSNNQNFARSLSGADIPSADRFSAAEDRGRALFIQAPPAGKGCAGCHQPPTFALAANSRSNGLDAGETIIFKSPSLKNVGVNGRFMHDGRFSTLAQVLNHYAIGIQAGPALDNRLRIGGVASGAPGVPMSLQDQSDIVAFLQTLTDTALSTDIRFTTPFIK